MDSVTLINFILGVFGSFIASLLYSSIFGNRNKKVVVKVENNIAQNSKLKNNDLRIDYTPFLFTFGYIIVIAIIFFSEWIGEKFTENIALPILVILAIIIYYLVKTIFNFMGVKTLDDFTGN